MVIDVLLHSISPSNHRNTTLNIGGCVVKRRGYRLSLVACQYRTRFFFAPSCGPLVLLYVVQRAQYAPPLQSSTSRTNAVTQMRRFGDRMNGVGSVYCNTSSVIALQGKMKIFSYASL